MVDDDEMKPEVKMKIPACRRISMCLSTDAS